MPIPLIKVVLTTAKIMARPINGIMMNRFKHAREELRSRHFFIWFGRQCVKLENISDSLLIQDKEKVKLFQVDPYKISEEAALTKGIEYFVEMFFFYGVIFTIVIYEIRKAFESSAKLKANIQALENEEKANIENLLQLEAEMASFEDPSKLNKERIIYLKAQIDILYIQISQLEE